MKLSESNIYINKTSQTDQCTDLCNYLVITTCSGSKVNLL